jgi:hypothetical protein
MHWPTLPRHCKSMAKIRKLVQHFNLFELLKLFQLSKKIGLFIIDLTFTKSVQSVYTLSKVFKNWWEEV